MTKYLIKAYDHDALPYVWHLYTNCRHTLGYQVYAATEKDIKAVSKAAYDRKLRPCRQCEKRQEREAKANG